MAPLCLRNNLAALTFSEQYHYCAISAYQPNLLDYVRDKRYQPGISAVFKSIFSGAGKPVISLSSVKQCTPFYGADISDTVYASGSTRSSVHARARASERISSGGG